MCPCDVPRRQKVSFVIVVCFESEGSHRVNECATTSQGSRQRCVHFGDLVLFGATWRREKELKRSWCVVRCLEVETHTNTERELVVVGLRFSGFSPRVRKDAASVFKSKSSFVRRKKEEVVPPSQYMPFGLRQISLQTQDFRTDFTKRQRTDPGTLLPSGLTQAGLPCDPSRMQSSPQAMDTEWRPASGQATHYTNYVTIIVKFTDGLNLAALPHHEIGDRIIEAASLTSNEHSDTYIKVRDIQNLVAIDTYRPTVERKLLQLQQVSLADAARPVRTYLTVSAANARGVIHGIQPHISEEVIRQNYKYKALKSSTPDGLAHPTPSSIQSRTQLPRYALYNHVVMRLYPYRPRSLQCHHCYAIGHQADVCPKKKISITCPTCSTTLPIEAGIATPHTCEPFCLNCQGEHPPGTPTFPARAQADEQTQAGQKHRRKQFLTTHLPRKDPPPFISTVHWPALPTSNRFAALDNSSRSRSRSPGHQPETAQTTTKKPVTQAVTSAPSRGLNHNPRRRHKTTIDSNQTKNISKENSLKEPEQRPRESSSVYRPAPCATQPTHSCTTHPHPTYSQALEQARVTPITDNIVKAMQAGLQPHTTRPQTPSLTLPTLPRTTPNTEPILAELQQIKATMIHMQNNITQLQETMEKRDALMQNLAEQVAHLTQRIEQFDSILANVQATLARNEMILRKRPHTTPPDTPDSPNKIIHAAAYRAHPLLVAGDFNSHNTAWDYTHTTPNGRKLEDFMSDSRFSLLNDTTITTRVGNSVEHDTNPDLTWYRGNPTASWENSLETLGSDHCILVTTLTFARDRSTPNRGPRTKITKWTRVREELESTPFTPATLSAWTKAVRNAVIQTITGEAEDYAYSLGTETWLQLCDQLNGQLHTPRVWQILRTLLGQSKPRHTMTKLQMHTNKTKNDLTNDNQKLFYPQKTHPLPLPSYPTETLEDQSRGINSPFTMSELVSALHSLKRNTTPGMDKITYAMLRNLPETYLDSLLQYINEAWDTGILPQEWK
ncbi:hypothetical protein HPB47_028096 [Ixodes persulcatus]|uniref:Uncharacterized protein n=1 Tax=Ixodes persulcatus TaxID=34615 RepID=A0AC60PU83_IXOPE|nr:hypothetical protein HPB47_028096 [Ixodes persulcatus]